MIPRAFLIWLGLMVVAIGNGVFREAVLWPRVGETAGRIAGSLKLRDGPAAELSPYNPANLPVDTSQNERNNGMRTDQLVLPL